MEKYFLNIVIKFYYIYYKSNVCNVMTIFLAASHKGLILKLKNTDVKYKLFSKFCLLVRIIIFSSNIQAFSLALIRKC